MKKKWILLFAVLIGIVVFSVACGKSESKETSETATEETTQQTEEVNNITLYIGNKDNFGKYNWPYTGELTPQVLIEGIAGTTGWNLSLDKKVTRKEDGYIICFGKKSVFYTGQKLDSDDEFYVPGEENFYITVLDSITRTIKEYYEEDDGALNLYFWGEDDSVLLLSGIGKTIAKDTAYEYGVIKATAQRRYISESDATKYDVEGTFISMQGDEVVEMEVDGDRQIYAVTYTALKAIFRNAKEGRQMRIQITEDVNTGDKLITKIY
jgi:hypothetical protein